MRKQKRTRVIDWLGCSAFMAVALVFIVAGEFSRRYGTTPESELILITGSASTATLSQVNGRYGQMTDYLRFTINNYVVNYSSDMNGYDQVLEAVKNGIPLTIGVSTKRETLFPRDGWVPLYSLSIGTNVLLTYQDTVSQGYRGSNSPFIIGGFLAILSSWSLYSCFKGRKLSND